LDFTLATHKEILQELGVRLRAQRLAQELPQAELAAMAGVSLGTIKSLERSGVSSLETLIRVVQALGLTDHLQPLFELPRQSIAAMEKAQQAQRMRAPRRKASVGTTAQAGRASE
jgi:transcriptional regulator with XRE-family HTH domain